ncbi:MAG: alpha/beta hydrolase, partial [Acidobacteriia bacterium]|nr:alpha/beta hydrolase [Terriglobia bacterium]
AGFSFGAAVGLRATCPDHRVKAVIGMGLPVTAIDERVYDFSFLQTCAKPKLFVSGTRDQFGPRPQLERLVETLPEPRKLVRIESADHFFEGRLREMREAIEEWIRGL